MIALTCYSQNSLVNSSQTIRQATQLLYELKGLRTIDSLKSLEIKEKAIQIGHLEAKTIKQDSIILNCNTAIQLSEQHLEQLELQLKQNSKSLKRQKRLTALVGIVSLVLIVLI